MKKRKICVVITARPSYSRVRTVLDAIKNHNKLDLQLIVSGSALLERYGKIVNLIEKDGFKIYEKIYNVLDGETPTTMAKTAGFAIMELATSFNNLKPDMVITIADRYETIATSIAASYQNIPLAHIQGGEVTGNIDEKVRHANTKLADIHFVSSKMAMERVIKMGEKESTVFNTGCPSIDIAKKVLETKINFDPIKKYKGVGSEIKLSNDYIVVMQHPVTTEYGDSIVQITETLKAVKNLNIPTYWFWPNVDAGSDGTSAGIRKFREKNDIRNIHFFKNMKPEDFLSLIMMSKCLVGNSSVGIRESSFLGIPVVNIGSRQYRRERGQNVIDCDYAHLEIEKSIKFQLGKSNYKSEHIFGSGNAGEKIAEILAKCRLSFHKTLTY